MTKVITITNKKGWWGKTTTVVNLSTTLSKWWKKVLVFDFDEQCDVSTTLIWKEFKKLKWIECLFWEQKEDIKDLIHKNKEGVYIVPWNIDYYDLINKRNLSNLSKEIEKIKYNYDYILIDTPPSRENLVVLSWKISDYLLIPISDVFSLSGSQQLLKRMIKIKKESNRNLKFLICFNKVVLIFNGAGMHITKNFRYLIEELIEWIKNNKELLSCTQIIWNFIRYSRDLDTSNWLSMSVMDSIFKDSRVQKDYIEFTKEFYEKTQK